MATEPSGQRSATELRLRARARLTESGAALGERADSFAAFETLFELASSPSTAPRALTLLHELQVHQVELDLQDEELRRSRMELEGELQRQRQLYDFMPVACLTIDMTTALTELNLTGARMLGSERDALIGRPLGDFLTAASGRDLHDLLARVGRSDIAEPCSLRLAVRGAAGDALHASVGRDPDGQHFLVALLSPEPDRKGLAS
jgi:PAS domain-containing protein